MNPLSVIDRTRTPLLLIAVCTVLAVASSGQGHSIKNDLPYSEIHRVVQIPNAPTGSGRCQFCHPAEVEGYARSAMAHSLRRAGQEPSGTVNAESVTLIVPEPTSVSPIVMMGEELGFLLRWRK